ncbi:dihydrodipicolinate synthase family protein [Streptomyces uncialis]|uniref:dihydrodipicolinate synthase family protein n=1 Tax=Streptomyces uncialis TaxID=1048205 RepID=UPI0037B2DE24
MTWHTPVDGLHVPLITPFTAEGTVAADALEALARAALDAGATGLVALGTTGETAVLDADERRTVVEVCARVCEERGAHLTVGAGSNDTRAGERALAGLAGTGASAALVTVPAFTRPSEEGVVAHFTRLAAACPVPLIVYHIPYRTGLPLSVDALRALARIPGVAAVKYAPGAITQDTMELLGDPVPGFSVLAGDDVFVSPLLALGASGAILASAHLATGRFTELAAAWRSGDTVRARDLGHALARMSAALFREPNPAVVKGVLHERGLIPTAEVRLPLLPARPDSVSRALRLLTEVEGTVTAA